MKGALAIFRWKMLPPLKLRDPFCVFAKRKPQNWWPEVESNHRHGDFQSPALPTELSGHNKVNAAVQVSPLTLLDQIDVYSAFTAVVKMTTAKKGVIKAKEVTGVK